MLVIKALLDKGVTRNELVALLKTLDAEATHKSCINTLELSVELLDEIIGTIESELKIIE